MNKLVYFRNRTDNHIHATCGLLADTYSNRPNEWEQLSQKAGKQAYAEQHADRLSKTLQICAHDGKTNVYCIIRSVSASGMSRVIDLFVVEPHAGRAPGPAWITYGASIVLGWRRHKDRGMVVNACGMDMAFHAVDCLQRSLPELEANGIQLASRIL